MSGKKSKEARRVKAQIGAQGLRVKTTRPKVEGKTKPKAADVVDAPSITKKRIGTERWTVDARQTFKDWRSLADFSPLMNASVDSTMATMSYGGIDREKFEEKWGWTTHLKKHLDRLYAMGVAAWGPSFAFVWHPEFGDEPHFHIWLVPFSGRSHYELPSRYASKKYELNGLVFFRWLEAAWSEIIGVTPNIDEPEHTWVASARQMREMYGQDASTPMRITNYFLKEGDSEEMEAKRVQLIPPKRWVERGIKFRWAGSYGLSLDYVEVDDIAPAGEAALREEISKTIDPVYEICGDTGEIRNVARLSPDARQGGRQYEVLDENRREALVAAARLAA